MKADDDIDKQPLLAFAEARKQPNKILQDARQKLADREAQRDRQRKKDARLDPLEEADRIQKEIDAALRTEDALDHTLHKLVDMKEWFESPKAKLQRAIEETTKAWLKEVDLESNFILKVRESVIEAEKAEALAQGLDVKLEMVCCACVCVCARCNLNGSSDVNHVRRLSRLRMVVLIRLSQSDGLKKHW